MISIEDIPTPEVVYRYRHLVGKHREWTEKIITESILHFASPTTFNDPFDCKVHYRKLTATNSELKKRYGSVLKNKLPHCNRAQRRGKAVKDLKGFNRKNFLISMTDGFQATVDKVGVLSLSKFRDNIVMWSHYAESHTGLCLGFSTAVDPDFFARCRPMDYVIEYPVIEMIRDSSERQVEAFLRTKAIGWKYEDEWRIIDHKTGSGNKVFLEDALVEIILGANMDVNDRQFILDSIKKRKHPVSVFEASANPGSYVLDIQPCEL